MKSSCHPRIIVWVRSLVGFVTLINDVAIFQQHIHQLAFDLAFQIDLLAGSEFSKVVIRPSSWTCTAKT
jgi:hypothetical protein